MKRKQVEAEKPAQQLALGERCGLHRIAAAASLRPEQCASKRPQELLKEQGVTCNMSRAGEVWNNSAMKSFVSSLKTERTAAGFTEVESKPAQTCSTTSRAPTTRPGLIRLWATSVRNSSRKLKMFRSMSIKPAADHPMPVLIGPGILRY